MGLGRRADRIGTTASCVRDAREVTAAARGCQRPAPVPCCCPPGGARRRAHVGEGLRAAKREGKRGGSVFSKGKNGEEVGSERHGRAERSRRGVGQPGHTRIDPAARRPPHPTPPSRIRRGWPFFVFFSRMWARAVPSAGQEGSQTPRARASWVTGMGRGRYSPTGGPRHHAASIIF